jgi:phospholipid/cholesterol/gamma-HCH transport system substrate-binding protein
MKRTIVDLWVGIFVVIGIVSITFLAFHSANLMPQSSKKSYMLYAEFNNVGSLAIKAPVRSSGVIIGRVVAIKLDPKKYLARVQFSVNNTYRFSRDVSAEIMTSGLLGEQYINLTQGAEQTFIEPNEQVTITSSAIVLEQLVDQFISGLNQDKP